MYIGVGKKSKRTEGNCMVFALTRKEAIAFFGHQREGEYRIKPNGNARIGMVLTSDPHGLKMSLSAREGKTVLYARASEKYIEEIPRKETRPFWQKDGLCHIAEGKIKIGPLPPVFFKEEPEPQEDKPAAPTQPQHLSPRVKEEIAEATKPTKNGYDDADLREAIKLVNEIANEVGASLFTGSTTDSSGKISGYRVNLKAEGATG